MGNDNCVRHGGLFPQLPKSPARAHYVKARVKGSTEYPDGCLAVFHGPRRPASDTAEGALIEETRLAA